MDEPSDHKKKWTRIRRIALLAGGGLFIGALIATALGAIPRPVDVQIRLEVPNVEGRECYTVIRTPDETVVEATQPLRTEEQSSVSHRFWLSPEPHSIEIRVDGCLPVTRNFNPKDTNRVAFLYTCES